MPPSNEDGARVTDISVRALPNGGATAIDRPPRPCDGWALDLGPVPAAQAAATCARVRRRGAIMDDWLFPGATRDPQSVTSDWKLVGQELLDGVRVFESRNVVRATRTLAEIWRADWRLDDRPLDQLFQVLLEGGTVSAWHAHADTTDRLFVASGHVHLVLYDSRAESPTNGDVNLTDNAYDYESPDHWRVPPDSPHIPYTFR